MGTLYLVRHGQASFGTEDYDRLSDVGVRQSAALGSSWEAGGAVFTDAIAGGMVRHAQTAIAAIDASGLGEEDADPSLPGYDVDPRWNEYDHLGIATAFDPTAMTKSSKEFQAALNEAIKAWRAGQGNFSEPYAAFRERVMAGFESAVQIARQKGRRVLVFTSGGPIAMITSQLITGSDEAFQKINDVIVNSSVTTVMVGGTGPRILTFNDHGHLPAGDVTFR